MKDEMIKEFTEVSCERCRMVCMEIGMETECETHRDGCMARNEATVELLIKKGWVNRKGIEEREVRWQTLLGRSEDDSDAMRDRLNKLEALFAKAQVIELKGGGGFIGILASDALAALRELEG